jgi:transposase InsO family protein
MVTVLRDADGLRQLEQENGRLKKILADRALEVRRKLLSALQIVTVIGVRLRVRHCANRQTLKCLTIIDEGTRECLAIGVAGGIRSGRVIEILTQLVSVHEAPGCLRSDNGPEFVASAILRWSPAAQIETVLIDPAKPRQNGADESFNGASSAMSS